MAAAATPPTAPLEWRWWWTSESSSMIWRASAQARGAIGLALDEAVDELAAEVARARTLRQVEAGVADAVVDTVDVERVLHHAVADAEAPAGAARVAEEDDLPAV